MCETQSRVSADSTADQTFTISPAWDIDKNDVQQLVHLSEEKSSLFRYGSYTRSKLDTLFYYILFAGLTRMLHIVCSFIMCRLLEDSQLSMIEDVGDTCLVESGLGNYNDASAAPHYLMLNKQNSFEHDESLGILTPDQMTDFTVALECSRTPSCENLTGSAGSKLALTRASASTRPLVDVEPAEEGCTERTPSPEELPLDPKPVEPVRGSAVPVSFVTSVTSITSLEAGYQGDGENSRPASRGADPPSMAVPPVNPCTLPSGSDDRLGLLHRERRGRARGDRARRQEGAGDRWHAVLRTGRTRMSQLHRGRDGFERDLFRFGQVTGAWRAGAGRER